MCLHDTRNKVTFVSKRLGLQAIYKLFTIRIWIKYYNKNNQIFAIAGKKLEPKRFVLYWKRLELLLFLTWWSHGREETVQLAGRIIFDIVPHFETQVGASIL